VGSGPKNALYDLITLSAANSISRTLIYACDQDKGEKLMNFLSSGRALAFCAIASLAGFAQAQTASVQSTFGSSIMGTIQDAAGAAVPGVTLTVTNQESNTTQSSTSDRAGAYMALNLVPGSYEIVASKYGFKDAKARITLDARRQLRTDLKLELATVGANSAGDNVTAASIAKELEGMKGRFDELEKLLKLKLAQEQGTAGANSAPATLLATTGKDSSQIPPLPSALAKQQEPMTVAANTTAPGTPTQGPAAPGAVAAQGPEQTAPPSVDRVTPFADYDWTWLNGNSRQHDSPLDSKYFSGEFRADTFFGTDFNQPVDHSMGGSSEVFRSSEVQLEDLSLGGDFHAGSMRGRVLTLFGMFSATTVRNDASPAVGQWDVRAAYKYVSEAYGGYHFNVQHGLNIDAGIFVSYVGLFSYHNFDNWAYQPSYVSSNTPWFFNGVRIQWFPTNHLKIEPWFINGWQSYNKFNGHPGLGGQLKWTPNSWLVVIANQYGFGEDNVGLTHRQRYHTDDSIEIKYYDKSKSGNGIDRMAFTFTGDLGCETGDGVTCHGGHGAYNPVTGRGGPKQAFLGYMAYNRWWWHHDLFAFTLGGGQMNNPGRYLTLVLPVNGADAISGTPYFPAAPGLPLKAYDGTATLDWMPSQFATFRLEFGYRHTNIPYWSGRGGITPPGGNNGSPADFACITGASSGQTTLAAAEVACGGGKSSVWFPDLRKGQALLSLSIMVKL
jgi:hypothetical protein